MSDTNPGLSPNDAVMGMLSMLHPDRRFTNEVLRDFLKEESRPFPFLRPMFRMFGNCCGDKTDGIDDFLFFMEGALLRSVTKAGKHAWAVKRDAADYYLESLRKNGAFLLHEHLVIGMAQRFDQRLMSALRAPA